MLRLQRKADCCGCTACANACPKRCITMEPDKEGFLYPKIDTEVCVDCGLCEKVCPIQRTTAIPANSQAAYAAVSCDDAVRRESSSGGVFSLLAEYVLAQGGIVYGASFADDMTVKHIAVENTAELYKLRGSKYVQSRLEDIYSQVKAQLKSGRLVLFTGTPCQIGGLHAFLGKDYENLLCQDLICHGVPSPDIWEKYVHYREAQAGSRAVNVAFRDKTEGWTRYSMCFKFENSTVYRETLQKDPYMRVFLRDLCLRPSCYACSFKGQQRLADITLADFWGVHDLLPQMHDDKGTSLVFVSTPKGQALWDAITPRLKTCPADAQAAITRNPAMLRSVQCPTSRDSFMAEVTNENFEQLAKKYCPAVPLHKKLLQKVKRFAKKLLHR